MQRYNNFKKYKEDSTSLCKQLTILHVLTFCKENIKYLRIVFGDILCEYQDSLYLQINHSTEAGQSSLC